MRKNLFITTHIGSHPLQCSITATNINDSTINIAPTTKRAEICVCNKNNNSILMQELFGYINVVLCDSL